MHDAGSQRGGERAWSLGDPPPTSRGPRPHPPAPEPVEPRPGEEWIGWRVTDELGRSIGHVEGTVGDRWLIVGRWASDHVLAPVADAIAGGGTVYLPYAHELIDSAPRQHPAAPIRRRRLESARHHYGLG